MPIDKSWPGYDKGIEVDEGFEWVWQEAIPADEPNRDPKVVHIPFGYEKRVLPRGWQKTRENMPLELDIIFEKDVEIVMRDGVKVRESCCLSVDIQIFDSRQSDLHRYLSCCRHGR